MLVARVLLKECKSIIAGGFGVIARRYSRANSSLVVVRALDVDSLQNVKPLATRPTVFRHTTEPPQ